MRIVFMGTPETAVEILEAMINSGADIVGVVTQTDKPRGRHAAPMASGVKLLSQRMLPGCPILQPERAQNEAFIEEVAKLRPDLIVVVAYGQILPKKLLDLPTFGAINVHFSLLPLLRGAAPIQQAILSGHSTTGVCIMRMAEKMDAGAILFQESVPITLQTTSGSLRQQLSILGSIMLITKALPAIKSGLLQETKQDESRVTFAPKIDPKKAQIDWNSEASYIHKLVRAMDPHPGAWTMIKLKGQPKRLKLFSPTLYPYSEASQADPSLLGKLAMENQPGRILVMAKELLIAAKGGLIGFGRLQVEGKSIVSSNSFAAGYEINDLEIILRDE